jgi:uncharacterized protein (DUF849 family)
VARPVIIEVALNGGLRKDRNPRVPRSPDEIAADALACLDAGAAIAHNHNDEPVLGSDGRHDAEPYLAAWRQILAQRPDALLYPTMPSGGPGIRIEDRYAHIVALAEAKVLGLGLVDPGTTNIGRFNADGSPRADDWIYQNSFADGVHMVETCRTLGVGLSVSIFEPGFVKFILGYVQADRLPPGTLMKFYFGGHRGGFGLPPTATALDAYLEMIDGTRLPWLVSVQGGDVVDCGLAEHAIERGGHLQVGLEPSGDPRRSNFELVEEAVKLCERLGCRPATSDEAASILGLPDRQRLD